MASNADHPLAGYAASAMPMSARLVSILIQRRRWPEPCTPARPIRDASGRTERRFRVRREPGRWSCAASICMAACREASSGLSGAFGPAGDR